MLGTDQTSPINGNFQFLQSATTSITSNFNKIVPISTMELVKQKPNNSLPRDNEKSGFNEPHNPKKASKNEGKAKDSKQQLTSTKYDTPTGKARGKPQSNKMKVSGK